MIFTELFENANQPMAEVAGPEKCWPGHRKVGTKPGTGKHAGKRVNDCKKIDEQGVAEGSEDDIEEQRYKFKRIKFRGTDHDIGEERYAFAVDGNPMVFNFSSDEDNPDPDSPSFEEILARVQRDGAVEHFRITPAEQRLVAKKIEAERRKYLDQRKQGVAEGLPQTLRKFVPGYAKREIDKKMDAQKFGRTDVDKDANYYRYKKIQDKIADKDVAEAMKPSDIPPSMRQRLTMRDVEAERPQGAFRFRVVTPRGDAMDFMDRSAAAARAQATGGRVEPIDAQSRGMPVTQIPEEKKNNPRIERILKMLRARHPQAEDDLEALIFDFRGQQSQDRSDIARLDAENDAEEADIARLEKMLDLIRQRRGASAVTEDDQDAEMQDFLARGGKIQQEPGRMPRLGTRLRQHGSRHIGQGREPRAGQLSGRGANINVRGGKPVVAAEGLQPGEYHVATVTLDDGTVKRVRITADENFRDRIHRHFALQDREVTDIDVDYAVRSDLDEEKPRFTGAPARPQPQPVNPSSPMLPPAPGRPGFVETPVQEAKKKPVPTNPELWGRAKSAARAKFDVYPSAYANGWAAKWYKSKGGGWRMGKPKKK